MTYPDQNISDPFNPAGQQPYGVDPNAYGQAYPYGQNYYYPQQQGYYDPQQMYYDPQQAYYTQGISAPFPQQTQYMPAQNQQYPHLGTGDVYGAAAAASPYGCGAPSGYGAAALQPLPDQPHRSRLSTSALIIGIFALLLSFLPVFNVFGFLLGFIGLVLAVIGLISTIKRQRAGMIVSILSTAFCAMSVAAVITILALCGTSPADLFVGPNIVTTTKPFTPTNASNANADSSVLKKGTSITLSNGLLVVMKSAQKGGASTAGDNTTIVNVTYTNVSDHFVLYSMFDWRGFGQNGGVQIVRIVPNGPNPIVMGMLMPGESVTGNLYFADALEKIEYTSSAIQWVTGKATATWSAV